MDGDREAFGMWVQFRRDLWQAAGVLVGDPLLPALTAILNGSAVALGRLGHGWTVLVLPLDLFLLGFAGTQRVWFLRGFHFRTLDPDEIWSMTLAFIPRFLLLSLVTGVSFVAAAFVLRGVGVPLTFASRAAAHPARRSLGVLVGLCLLADVALTFVTPALALSVHSWREALRRGLRMLWETWPASALYALTPGIAIFVLSASAPPKSSDGTFDVGLVAGAGAVLALWFKGAIVAFYVRRHPGVTDGGAAYADEPARRPAAEPEWPAPGRPKPTGPADSFRSGGWSRLTTNTVGFAPTPQLAAEFAPLGYLKRTIRIRYCLVP